MGLDSPGRVLYVKNTNVKKIGREDLIIRGVLYSKLCAVYNLYTGVTYNPGFPVASLGFCCSTAVLIPQLHPVAPSIHSTRPGTNSMEKTKVKQKNNVHTVLTLHNTSQFRTMTISAAPATPAAPSPLTRKI